VITRSALYPPTTTTFGWANLRMFGVSEICFLYTDATLGSLEMQP
jgi:hypothetical protein